MELFFLKEPFNGKMPVTNFMNLNPPLNPALFFLSCQKEITSSSPIFTVCVRNNIVNLIFIKANVPTH